MKVVVLSDTHLDQVNSELVSICETYCATADLVIHLGDWTRSVVLDFFQQFPLEAVSGNMDDAVIRDQLPSQKTLTLDGRRIGITHGWGYETGMHERLLQAFPDVEVILYGHTHRPLAREENGVLFFNPGSLTYGRGRFQKSLGIFETGEKMEANIIHL